MAAASADEAVDERNKPAPSRFCAPPFFNSSNRLYVLLDFLGWWFATIQQWKRL